MKPKYWAPVHVFLGVSLPVLLLLQALQLAPEYRLWIALSAGVLATACVQARLKSSGEKQ